MGLTFTTRGAAPTTSVYPGTPSGVNIRTGPRRVLICTVGIPNDPCQLTLSEGIIRCMNYENKNLQAYNTT